MRGSREPYRGRRRCHLHPLGPPGDDADGHRGQRAALAPCKGLLAVQDRLGLHRGRQAIVLGYPVGQQPTCKTGAGRQQRMGVSPSTA